MEMIIMVIVVGIINITVISLHILGLAGQRTQVFDVPYI